MRTTHAAKPSILAGAVYLDAVTGDRVVVVDNHRAGRKRLVGVYVVASEAGVGLGSRVRSAEDLVPLGAQLPRRAIIGGGR